LLQNNSARFVKIRTAAVGLVVVVVIGLVIGGIVLATHWPFSQARVKQNLEETFPATVTFQKFHATYFPHPGCEAEGAAFERLGRPAGTPAVVTIERLSIQAHYLDMLFRPGYLARIVMQGFRAEIPRLGTPLEDSGWKETPSTTRIGTIIADGAVVEIARADSRAPLRFEIHSLKLGEVSRNAEMSYDVFVHNPLPPGDIRSSGKFGPWNASDPGQTAIKGEYSFRHADLSVFEGLAGMLSSDDSFQGILKHIEARGTVDIPDFMVKHSQHAVHVSGEFHALINGTNGDVALDRVSAAFLHTNVLAKADISGHAGQEGKTANVDLSVRDGHIQDVLLLFVRGSKAPLNGVTSFRAHVVIPPGDRPFLEKVRLVGDFGIQEGHFVNSSTEASVETLSESARGMKPDSTLDPQDQDRVLSDLSGHVDLHNATANFSDLSFRVPGAWAQMHGIYNVESKAIDLHGTLKTDSEFSQMTSGFKSALLKPFDSFFRRKHHPGSRLAIHLLGTYDDPQAGVDLTGKRSHGGKAASGAN
jgi:hypothetical protein